MLDVSFVLRMGFILCRSAYGLPQRNRQIYRYSISNCSEMYRLYSAHYIPCQLLRHKTVREISRQVIE